METRLIRSVITAVKSSGKELCQLCLERIPRGKAKIFLVRTNEEWMPKYGGESLTYNSLPVYRVCKHCKQRKTEERRETRGIHSTVEKVFGFKKYRRA